MADLYFRLGSTGEVQEYSCLFRAIITPLYMIQLLSALVNRVREPTRTSARSTC